MKILRPFRKLIYILVTLVVLVVFFLWGISFYLSPQDKLIKADAIVVISGGNTNARISEGVKLFQEEYAPTLIFSGAAATGSVSNAKAMNNIAISRGVSAKDILIEETSKTTRENAQNVSKIIKNLDYKSIILVTSPYHQRRAYTEFSAALGEGFVIINHSARDSKWRKQDWWSNETARFLTIGEVLKNFYALFK